MSKVKHPDHYQNGASQGGSSVYETIKVIEAWGLGFHLGNTVKYISRAGKKHDNILEDLKKAKWYLDRVIKRYEEGSATSLDASNPAPKI